MGFLIKYMLKRGLSMDYKKLTAPCGIDCFNCEVFKDNVTPKLQERLAPVFRKKPEEITCEGCRTSGCLLIPFECPTRECVDKKGHEFCSECDEFPCNRLHPCADKAGSLPHNLKLFNLCRIKTKGIEKWAQEAKGIRERYFKGEMIIGKGPQLQD